MRIEFKQFLFIYVVVVFVPTVLISLVSPAVGPALRTLIGQKHLTFQRKIQLKNQNSLNPLFHYRTIQLPPMHLLMMQIMMIQARTLPMNHMYQEKYIQFRLIIHLELFLMLLIEIAVGKFAIKFIGRSTCP